MSPFRFVPVIKSIPVRSGKFTHPAEVSSGVPQGSVLGPLLFILYVNDLPAQVNSFCKLFADDAKLYKDLQNLEDFESLGQNKIYVWFRSPDRA